MYAKRIRILKVYEMYMKCIGFVYEMYTIIICQLIILL